jgi:hypothetical protein
MSDMPMPGSRAMSIAVSVLMMVAMMLPSSALMLRRDRQLAGRRGEPHLLRRVAIVGAGYFLVWIAINAAAVPLGSMLARRRPDRHERHRVCCRRIPIHLAESAPARGSRTAADRRGRAVSARLPPWHFTALAPVGI